jgi:L-malate glycosyltransferase
MTGKNPYRVCFITPEYPPDWGGGSKSARRIVSMLVAGGLDVHVFAPVTKAAPAGAGPQSVDGVQLYRVPVDQSSLLSAMTGYADAINRVDQRAPFDIFHGFFLPMAFPCLMVAQKGLRPVIASIRGDDGVRMLNDMTFRQGIVKVLKHAAWITSVSTESLVRANELEDISRRSSFIPNSIDLARLPSWTESDASRGVVGTACTFRVKKNIPLLINSYAAVRRELRRKLLLVGDYIDTEPEVKPAVQHAIATCGIQSDIEFAGYVDNERIPEYLSSMNVFVLSSDHEGLPNSVLEAAATGVPVVATAVHGVKDVYGDSGRALLVPPQDPRALSAAIESVLADRDLARRLSEGSLEIAKQFAPQREARCWLDLYQRHLGEKRPLAASIP